MLLHKVSETVKLTHPWEGSWNPSGTVGSHSAVPRDRLQILASTLVEADIPLTYMFLMVGGNQSTQRKPTWMQNMQTSQGKALP